jgi:uncharacterized membrane protein YdjX (TVP38/TMEM64 family)
VTPRIRLAALVVAITVVPVLLAVLHVVSADQLRDQVESFGPFAPVAWVFVSAGLGALLFPGPVLAGAGGLLFGAAVGTVTTVASALLSSLVSLEIGRRAGYDGAVEVLGWRAEAVERISRQEGAAVVLVQRLLPGVPDAPMSYAFGALGISRRDMLIGTAIGTLPRAFSYTALGASLDDPTSPLAYAGAAGVVLSAVLGAVVGRRAWKALRT